METGPLRARVRFERPGSSVRNRSRLTDRFRRALLGGVVVAGVVAGVPLVGVAPPAGAAVPAGFVDEVVFRGLELPTNVEFAPDGKVFVTEKSGLVQVFSGLGDTSASVFADLRTETHSLEDRGMLGLAVDPGYPASPYVYVAYTRDAPVGGTPPRWGSDGGTHDGSCPNPVTSGCPASSRIVRLTGSGLTATGQKVLVDGFCQQPFSHSIGDLVFGPDGALYGAHGDGASAATADYGQFGNACGDPPGAAGTNLTAPGAEGGALRSQDLRTTGDPLTLNGSLFRIDPETGAGVSGNPLASSGDPNARRILAHGLRNPFRFAFRPGTSEVWIGDVGWLTWEEINRATPAAPVENFGWPCYEGTPRQPQFDNANLNLCERLYSAGGVEVPHLAYDQTSKVVANGACPAGGEAANGGMAFYTGTSYPAKYHNALFFADYARDCIFVMRTGGTGVPSKNLIEEFVVGAPSPVDLEVGPGGDLFYVDIVGGTVHRIRALSAGVNNPPTAVATATPRWGNLPLTVAFDGTASSDPDGDALSHAWDLDGDGAFDDAATATPTRTYTVGGTVTVRLRVTDAQGASDTASVRIDPGATAPVPVIDKPAATLTWRPGDRIDFAGHARDGENAQLPASRLSWKMDVYHCETSSSCHYHPLTGFSGVASGSFTAPDHPTPSYVQVALTATDSNGLAATSTIRLEQAADTTPLPRSGYWMVGAKGDVYAFGDAHWHGNADVGARSATDIEATPGGDGYWIVDDGGRVHSFGGARHLGDLTSLAPGEWVVSLSATSSGDGYWVVTSMGRAAAFGDARHRGDMAGIPLQGPVLDSTRTPAGVGYWMVASDGGVFSFGDARFHGSMGGRALNAPVISLAPDGDTGGYWLVATDGGVFAFDAPFRGSMGGTPLNQSVVGMVPYGDGYLMVASDGGIFSFSNLPFRGSLGSTPPAVPVVAVAALQP